MEELFPPFLWSVTFLGESNRLVRQRVTTYSVYSVMSIGHDTDMQVKSKASHQNGEMRYAQTERYESRKNVKMVSWLNPKIPLQS